MSYYQAISIEYGADFLKFSICRPIFVILFNIVYLKIQEIYFNCNYLSRPVGIKIPSTKKIKNAVMVNNE